VCVCVSVCECVCLCVCVFRRETALRYIHVIHICVFVSVYIYYCESLGSVYPGATGVRPKDSASYEAESHSESLTSSSSSSSSMMTRKKKGPMTVHF